MRQLTAVWLSSQAHRLIELEACRYRLRETGGPLLGYEAEDGSLVIEIAHGAGPRARHGRFRYSPDREATQAIIDDALSTSDGCRYLIGEWHSHPLGRAKPSNRDRRSLSDTAADAGVGLSHPVALIQATLPWGRRVRPGQLTAWIGEANEQTAAGDLRRFTVRLR
jgi:integrative and conjugative element protein (TIGR02256 family)